MLRTWLLVAFGGMIRLKAESVAMTLMYRNRLLSRIRDLMVAWSHIKGVNAFLSHDSIVQGIKEGHEAISDCLNLFVVGRSCSSPWTMGKSEPSPTVGMVGLSRACLRVAVSWRE